MRRSQKVASTSAVELDAALPFTIFAVLLRSINAKFLQNTNYNFITPDMGLENCFYTSFCRVNLRWNVLRAAARTDNHEVGKLIYQVDVFMILSHNPTCNCPSFRREYNDCGLDVDTLY